MTGAADLTPDPALAREDDDLLAEAPDLQRDDAADETEDPRDLATETLMGEGEHHDASEEEVAEAPADVPSRPFQEGFTAAEEQRGETLEERLEQEVPEVDPRDAAAADLSHDVREV